MVSQVVHEIHFSYPIATELFSAGVLELVECHLLAEPDRFAQIAPCPTTIATGAKTPTWLKARTEHIVVQVLLFQLELLQLCDQHIGYRDPLRPVILGHEPGYLNEVLGHVEVVGLEHEGLLGADPAMEAQQAEGEEARIMLLQVAADQLALVIGRRPA